MVSKPDLRVTNGYIIGVSQRLVCSGFVCTQILSHLSLWFLEAQRSVDWCNGHATLECSQNLRVNCSFTQTAYILGWCWFDFQYFSFPCVWHSAPKPTDSYWWHISLKGHLHICFKTHKMFLLWITNCFWRDFWWAQRTPPQQRHTHLRTSLYTMKVKHPTNFTVSNKPFVSVEGL